MRHRNRENGFAISIELLLIAVVLIVGLITGWTKLRDQSLSEIKDSMEAIDAYILGSGPLWQTGGTRWISAGTILEPSTTGAVTESWVDGTQSFSTVTVNHGVDGDTYSEADGVLVYGGAPTASSAGNGAGEHGMNPGRP